MELQPESDSQAAITPTQFIVHSLAAPWTIEQTYNYWKNSTNLESHFGLGYDGRLGQYIGTQTRADANASANVRAISLESAANTSNTDPWTDAQLGTLLKVMDWTATEHGIPRRVCRSWTDPGFGYHRMYPEWSTSGTYCPGDARATQFHEIIMPRLIAGETEIDMALTDAELDQIASRVWSHRLTSPTAPEGTDPTREAGTFLRYTDAKHSQTTSLIGEVKTQSQANGSALTAANLKLDAVITTLGSIDLSELPAEIAAKLSGLKFVLTEEV
jgi:hypothetical protein